MGKVIFRTNYSLLFYIITLSNKKKSYFCKKIGGVFLLKSYQKWMKDQISHIGLSTNLLIKSPLILSFLKIKNNNSFYIKTRNDLRTRLMHS